MIESQNPFTESLIDHEPRLRLIGRDRIIIEAVRKLTRAPMPDSILLVGVRGAGKTAILQGVLQEESLLFSTYFSYVHPAFQHQPESLRFLYLSFQSFRKLKETDFRVELVFQALADGLESLNEQQYVSLTVAVRDTTVSDFDQIYARFQEAVRQLQSKNWRPIIGLDDFDYVLDHMKPEYLNLLRVQPSVAFVVPTAYSPREWRVRNPGIGDSPMFNVLVVTPVPLFERNEAEAFVREVLQGAEYNFNQRTLNYLLDQAGGFPILLLLLGEQLYNLLASGRSSLSASELGLAARRVLDRAWLMLTIIWSQFEDEHESLRALVFKQTSIDQKQAELLLEKRIITEDEDETYRLTSRLLEEYVRYSATDSQEETQPAPLRPLEERFFRYISEHSGEVCLFEDLYKVIWPTEAVQPQDKKNALMSLASRVRNHPSVIKQGELRSIRSEGYKFEPK